jgi:hypothetical protein
MSLSYTTLSSSPAGVADQPRRAAPRAADRRHGAGGPQQPAQGNFFTLHMHIHSVYRLLFDPLICVCVQALLDEVQSEKEFWPFFSPVPSTGKLGILDYPKCAPRPACSDCGASVSGFASSGCCVAGTHWH